MEEQYIDIEATELIELLDALAILDLHIKNMLAIEEKEFENEAI